MTATPSPSPMAYAPLAPTTYARPATPALRLAAVAAVASDAGHARALLHTATPGALDTLLGALLDALRSERRLLDDLASTMRRQRAAVGGDDLQAVDDSVFATHRILATLGQARVRRRQLNRLLCGAEELPARDLDAVLGDRMTEPLRSARDELQASAGALSHEVEVNRRVLRDALASGDAHARALTHAGAATGMTGGAVLDRTA